MRVDFGSLGVVDSLIDWLDFRSGEDGKAASRLYLSTEKSIQSKSNTFEAGLPSTLVENREARKVGITQKGIEKCVNFLDMCFTAVVPFRTSREVLMGVCSTVVTSRSQTVRERQTFRSCVDLY